MAWINTEVFIVAGGLMCDMRCCSGGVVPYLNVRCAFFNVQRRALDVDNIEEGDNSVSRESICKNTNILEWNEIGGTCVFIVILTPSL